MATIIKTRPKSPSFLPIDMTRNDGFADRIVRAIKEYGVDSTFVATSEAAKKLGLPRPWLP
jgi:hypothetical protein